MKYVNERISDKLTSRLRGRVWYRHGIYRAIFLWAAELTDFLGKDDFAKEGISKGLDNAISIGGEFFIVQDEFDEFCDLYDEKLKDGIPYLKNYILSYNKDMDTALLESKKIGNVDAANISNQELGQRLLKHFECIVPLHHWLWSMEFLNESFDRKIHVLMKKNYPTWTPIEIDTFLGRVSYTSKKQFFQREEEEIVSLRDIDDPKLQDIFQEYRWLKMHFIDEQPFSYGEYILRAKDIIKHRDSVITKIDTIRQNCNEAKRLIDGVGDSELREYLLLMQELSYLKTYRIDVYTKTFFNVTNITAEITRRLGISFEQFLHHTKDEVVAALGGKLLSEEEIKSRDRWCVMKVDGVCEYFKGDKSLQTIRDAISGNGQKPKIINGTVAYTGIVKGKVRVSYSSKDIHKVEQGEILVCNLTNPDYNPVFKKLAGIITDEGGVLCHSAIMAREFRIPCIIGTKIATTVLKDGDMVEVDAEKGVVRIL